MKGSVAMEGQDGPISKATFDPEDRLQLQRLRSGTTKEESSVCGKESRQVQYPDVSKSWRWRSR